MSVDDQSFAGKPLAVPQSRFARMARVGGTMGRIAGSMAANGAQAWARGERPAMRDLMLTPRNMTRVADTLSRMRGAAMKVGQLLSMDGGDVLPPELTEVLARLRAEADFMPPKQLRTVLNANWGEGWLSKFRIFDVRPIAAASIGQVHKAETRDGRVLAIKVQYPGVRRSIDSDVNNVASMVKMAGLVPTGMEIGHLLEVAKRQLHEEADYAREAAQLAAWHDLIGDDPDLVVPSVAADFSTRDVLAMSFEPGRAVERFTEAPQALRDRIAHLLMALMFRELFALGRMQTDPNFANYRYDPERGKLVLLDFGAARDVPAEVAADYRALLSAGLADDRAGLAAAGQALGFFDGGTDAAHRDAVMDMIDVSLEAIRCEGPYDFGASDIIRRLHAMGTAIGEARDFLHVPHVETLYVQRKLAGMFLLAARLKARVDVGAIARAHL